MAYKSPVDGPPPPYTQAPAPVGFGGPQQVKVTVVEDNCFTPSYQQQTVITTQPQVVTATPVVVLGASCPSCRAGVLQNEFTCCGICLGIVCFPVGLICCFLMQERRCSNCRMGYGSV